MLSIVLVSETRAPHYLMVEWCAIVAGQVGPPEVFLPEGCLEDLKQSVLRKIEKEKL